MLDNIDHIMWVKNKHSVKHCNNTTTVVSLSGHATEANLIWTNIFATATGHDVSTFTFPFTKGHLSNVATISWQIGWPCYMVTTVLLLFTKDHKIYSIISDYYTRRGSHIASRKLILWSLHFKTTNQ